MALTTARQRVVGAVLVCAAVVSGCSSGSSNGSSTSGPSRSSTVASTTATPSTPSSTTSTTSSPSTTTTTSGSVATTSTVPDPIVRGLGSIPTVPLPSTTAPNPNLRPHGPADQPIIDAYVTYLTAWAEANSQNPIDPNSTLLNGLLDADFERFTRADMEDRRNHGQVLNVAGGVTLRPHVVADARSETEAIVFDCQLDGTYWSNAATGEPLPGETVTVHQLGASARMVLRNGRWIVLTAGPEGAACLPE
jgi:hypothetical protein